MDLFDLTGKTAVVTGGTRGIGLMIARGLLQAGASKVYISSRKAERCAGAERELSRYGQATAIRADLSAVAWDKLLDLNLKSPFFLTRAFLPMLEAAGTPDDPARVINIGSIDGLRVPPMQTY